MTTLEAAIADAMRTGVRGLTLFQTWDGRWQAASSVDRLGWRIEIAADPIEALTRLLGAPATSETATDNNIFG